MSRQFKVIAGAVALASMVALVSFRTRAGPDLANSPAPLRELIEKSDLIVYAKVAKIDQPLAALSSVTNRWAERAIKLFGAWERRFVTVHLEVMQTVKGRPVER